MIEKLKFMIDQSENNPKLKKIFLQVAELPEEKQETMLEIMQIMVDIEYAKTK
jgi:hypothetical protein